MILLIVFCFGDSVMVRLVCCVCIVIGMRFRKISVIVVVYFLLEEL